MANISASIRVVSLASAVEHDLPIAAVSYSSPTAEVNAASLVSTAGYDQPITSVSYDIPLAEVEYILIHTEVALDGTGRYRMVVDSVVTTDGSVLQLGKALGDAQSFSEVVGKQVARPVADALVMADYFARRVQTSRKYDDGYNQTDRALVNTSRVSRDSVSLLDGTAKAAGLVRRDVAPFTDAASRSAGLVRQDATAFTDTVSRALGPGHADSYTFMDAASRSAGLARQDAALFTDTSSRSSGLVAKDAAAFTDAAIRSSDLSAKDAAAFTDAASRALDVARADSSAITDGLGLSGTKALFDAWGSTDQINLALAINRTFGDGFALNDSTGVGDGVAFISTKTILNTVVASDAASYGFGRALVDSSTAQDAGSLLSQGYCDFSYFVSDYVGDSRSF